MEVKINIKDGEDTLGMFLVIDGKMVAKYAYIDPKNIPRLKEQIFLLISGLGITLMNLGFLKKARTFLIKEWEIK